MSVHNAAQRAIRAQTKCASFKKRQAELPIRIDRRRSLSSQRRCDMLQNAPLGAPSNSVMSARKDKPTKNRRDAKRSISGEEIWRDSGRDSSADVRASRKSRMRVNPRQARNYFGAHCGGQWQSRQLIRNGRHRPQRIHCGGLHSSEGEKCFVHRR
jgi:hypothetical protein